MICRLPERRGGDPRIEPTCLSFIRDFAGIVDLAGE
jgi:hypothetical protein